MDPKKKLPYTQNDRQPPWVISHGYIMFFFTAALPRSQNFSRPKQNPTNETSEVKKFRACGANLHYTSATQERVKFVSMTSQCCTRVPLSHWTPQVPQGQKLKLQYSLGYKPDEKHSLDIIEKFLEYYIRLEAPSARRPFIFTKALFGKVDSGVFVSAAEAELLAHAVALPKNNCTLWDQGTKW